jgi:hypothetical protein
MCPTRRWALCAIVGASLLIPARGRTENNGVNIAGTWILNVDLSDNPRDVMRKKMEESRGSGGGMRGGPPGGGMRGGPPSGGMRGGPPGGGMRGGPGGESGGKDRLEQMEPPHKLIIIQEDQHVTLIPEGQDTLMIVADGKTHKQKTALGEVDIKATWKDLALELTTQEREGRETTRLYRIGDDGRLEVVTELTLPRGGDKVEIVTRYDEVSSE